MRKKKTLPSDNEVNIKFGSENLKIKPTMKKSSIRILGVWFNAFNKKDHVISQSMILRERLTDKKMSYIFNMLVIPKVKYRTQLLILSDYF